MKPIRIAFSLLLLLAGSLVFATCSNTPTTGPIEGDTPTQAYKRLFDAIKSKNTEAIKNEMTPKTVEFGVMAAERNKKSLEATYENGFTATTMVPSLPMIRDERIKGEMGAIEVWNANDNRWEDLPFVLHEGRWKLAVGELFAGTFTSPGKPRDLREREAANAMAAGSSPAPGNVDTVTVDPIESNTGKKGSK